MKRMIFTFFLLCLTVPASSQTVPYTTLPGQSYQPQRQYRQPTNRPVVPRNRRSPLGGLGYRRPAYRQPAAPWGTLSPATNWAIEQQRQRNERRSDLLEEYYRRQERDERRWRAIQRDLHKQDEADGLNILRNCAKYNKGCFNRLRGSGK